MKILTPLSCLDMVEELISAGADEFYLGYVDSGDIGRNKPLLYNRRGHTGNKGNFVCLSELEKTVNRIRIRGRECFLTLNNHSYPLSALVDLSTLAQIFIRFGGSGIICSDLNLVLTLVQEGIPVILSTCAVCTNSEDIDYWRFHGLSRFVLPRDLSTHEMEQLVHQYDECRFEAFIMNSRCRNIEGICSAHHGWGDNFCKQLRCARREYLTDGNVGFDDLERADMLYFKRINSERVCGVCSIWRLMHIGVHSVKIVERTLSPQMICQQVRAIRECIVTAADCETEDAYLSKIGDIIPYHSDCSNNLQCYYCQ